MKYLKMLGLAAVAAAALMAFVGASTASATVLCANNASTTACSSKLGVGTIVHAESVGKAILESGETILDECEGSTLQGKVTNAGGSGATVSGPVETLNWGKCTKTTTTTKLGSLEIHHNPNTLTVSGIEVTVETGFLGSCTYTASNIGTVVSGAPAKITINTKVKKSAGGFACPTEPTWTAEFKVTSPNPLYVAAA
jgi:hypothetical protein